ncbi:hypothetical protein J6590_080667 [Homalodisca vitripennis]|nr:hypothetical protein J6590_080667 [Homalodisca vitripennis]
MFCFGVALTEPVLWTTNPTTDRLKNRLTRPATHVPQQKGLRLISLSPSLVGYGCVRMCYGCVSDVYGCVTDVLFSALDGRAMTGRLLCDAFKSTYPLASFVTRDTKRKLYKPYISFLAKPSLTINLGINDLKVTSEPPPMTGQVDCSQGQDRSAVTHPSSSHARRYVIYLSCDNRCTRYTTPSETRMSRTTAFPGTPLGALNLLDDIFQSRLEAEQDLSVPVMTFARNPIT